MNAKPAKKDRIEVGSDQLRGELIEIKERVSALETIASISNKDVVEKYVRGSLQTPKSREIMKECEEPRTREQLVARFGFGSVQALDHHLNPLREADLLQVHFDDEGVQTFEWGNLFKRLPKKTLKQILDGKG
jgi:DNA-binding transcriptional ArsR family regulator